MDRKKVEREQGSGEPNDDAMDSGRQAQSSPENDFALRLHYETPIGPLFIHICEADRPESARMRERRVDRILADLKHEAGYFDFLNPEG